MSTLVNLSNLDKVYQTGELSYQALKNINLVVNEGDFIAIVGASGSGKSTLMNILGLLDHPTQGTYLLKNQDVSHLSEDHLAEIRNKKLGFVFQSFNLLPRTSSLNNVCLPLIYAKVSKEVRVERGKMVLSEVGLSDKENSYPNQLSGGQQQRVAIARAIINDPELVLADEPTGNLDTKTSDEIMGIFDGFNKRGKTIIMITHEENIARHAKRVIKLKDGEIVNK